MDSLQSPAHGQPVPVVQPGQEWFDVIRRPTLEAFAAAFGSNPSMDGSVLTDTLFGVAEIRRLFDATRRMYDTIAFTSEVKTPARVYLEWEGIFQGGFVAGVTVLTKDSAGLIEHVYLYHRPTGQVLAFSKELQLLLSQP